MCYFSTQFKILKHIMISILLNYLRVNRILSSAFTHPLFPTDEINKVALTVTSTYDDGSHKLLFPYLTCKHRSISGSDCLLVVLKASVTLPSRGPEKNTQTHCVILKLVYEVNCNIYIYKYMYVCVYICVLYVGTYVRWNQEGDRKTWVNIDVRVVRMKCAS